MGKYIGIKLITAEVMSLAEARQQNIVREDYNGIDEGYCVQYDNGYSSWSPADVFEKAYKEVPDNTIGLNLRPNFIRQLAELDRALNLNDGKLHPEFVESQISTTTLYYNPEKVTENNKVVPEFKAEVVLKYGVTITHILVDGNMQNRDHRERIVDEVKDKVWDYFVALAGGIEGYRTSFREKEEPQETTGNGSLANFNEQYLKGNK